MYPERKMPIKMFLVSVKCDQSGREVTRVVSEATSSILLTATKRNPWVLSEKKGCRYSHILRRVNAGLARVEVA